MITLGKLSLERLSTVHPDLRRVIVSAALTAPASLDFTVLEGVRSREQMMINYGKGRNHAQCLAKGVLAKYAQPGLSKVTWLNDPFNSPHRKHADGWSHAVDVAPFPIDWNNLARFDALAKHILASAKNEGVKITWGADWDADGKPREKGETDSPHFQLSL